MPASAPLLFVSLKHFQQPQFKNREKKKQAELGGGTPSPHIMQLSLPFAALLHLMPESN